mgnify:CR=1 FL=1
MKILVIKTGAMGDVLRTSFIAQALKDKFRSKNPKIFWITAKNSMHLFNNSPYVDEIIDSEFRYKVKNIPFDLVINLEESEDDCKFACSINSKKTIGFLWNGKKVVPSPNTREWFDMSILGEKPQNDILKKKNKKTHRQIIGEIVGIKNWERYEPFLRLDKRQRNITETFLRRHNLSRTDLIVGINTGAADRWPKALSEKDTAKLIDRIYKKFKCKIILFGGPNETERNKKVMNLVKSPVIDAGCGNDLLEFPALVSICSILITTDSLGMHIALALKRKTISLIGPTSSSEIDMYGLGDKIIAKSNCLCCYKPNCKSMNKIELNKIIKSIENLINEKITFLITAFKEPETIGKSIEAAINQETKYNYEIIVSAPDKETLEIAEKYAKKHKNVKTFKDPGKGKSFALNMIFEKIKTDILILSDGDVWVNDVAIESIANLFLDPEIGCLTGRPVPVENRKTKFGYWANLLFEGAHRMRKRAFRDNKFLECSGYLFAFRKNKIKKIPLDVAEDTVIPYFFWEKGYTIGYAEKSEVYVKNVDNLRDWIKQKVRTSKAHETLEKYVDTRTTKRAKTFKNEAKEGFNIILDYPKSIKEVLWTMQLMLARFYMWLIVFYDTKFRKKHYGDAWERVESTK